MNWPRNETFSLADIPLASDAGPDDLTGVDITKMTLYFRSASGVDTPGAGAISVKATYPAEIYYKFFASDVASQFAGSIVIKGLLPPSGTSADEAVWGPIPFVVT